MPIENQTDQVTTGSREGSLGPLETVRLSEAVRKELALGGHDPKDRIVVELAGEIDNLEDLFGKESIKPSSRASISNRRVSALKTLWAILVEREEKDIANSKVTLLASMMLQLKGVLSELSIPTEMAETVLQTLMLRIDDAETGKKREIEFE